MFIEPSDDDIDEVAALFREVLVPNVAKANPRDETTGVSSREVYRKATAAALARWLEIERSHFFIQPYDDASASPITTP